MGAMRHMLWMRRARKRLAERKTQYIIALLALVVYSIGSLAMVGSISFAQTTESAWTPPVRIFETEGALHEPTLLVDRSGLAHIFWTVAEARDGRLTGEGTLYYAQCCDNGKARQTDILALSSLISPRAVIDNAGEIHVIVSDGTQLYYTHALLDQAMSARNWAPPLLIDTATPHADITLDPRGRLYIAYSRFGATGLYYRTSDDAGRTWTAPVNIASTSGSDSVADHVRVAVTETGAIHVVWTELKLPMAWPPIGVFYARSDDGGQTFTEPLMMAGEGYDQSTILAADANTLHVAWNAFAGGRGRFHQVSSDGGHTWSGAVEMYPAAGTTGIPSLVADSAGVVHFLSSEGNAQGPVYSTWDRQGWSRPAAIASQGATLSNYVEEAVMSGGQGNRLHAVYWSDRKNLWYQSRTTQAPAVSMPAYTKPTSTPAPTPTEQPAPTAMAARPGQDTWRSAAHIPLDLADNSASQKGPLVAGIIPVVVLIISVLAAQYIRALRR